MVRATAEHQDVLEALGVESMRLGLDQWRFSAGRPRLDVRTCAAMDRLDMAEDERLAAESASDSGRNYCG